MENLTGNQILKGMINKIWKEGRTYFIKKLHVDIENCNPINVKELKYTKDQKENLFFFLDNNLKILMVLKGSEYKKEWSNYGAFPYDVPWNRKNIEPLSTYVLMITPEMIKEYKPHKITSHRRSNTAKENLAIRLKEYKNKKNQMYSHEQMKEMITEIMSFLTANIFQDKEYVYTYFNKIQLFERTMPRIVSDFAGIVNQYLSNYNDWEKERPKFEKEKYDFTFCYSYKELLKYKNEILDWNKTIENIKNQQEIV
jgi:hypothetical protein